MATPPKPSPSPLILATVVILLLTSTASSAADPVQNDLLSAMAEMQKANYFTFVMLLRMSAPSLMNSTVLKNITFLMPNDKTLSRTTIPPESLPDFLLRHSVPSPLLYDNLHLIPSGSLIPSSRPGYVLKIANGGRQSFFLNNVRLISPNICSSRWSSIRCHGIDDVLSPESNAFSSPSTCPNLKPPPAADAVSVPPPSSVLPPPLPSFVHGDQVPAPSPTPNNSGSSSSSSSMRRSYNGILDLESLLTFCLILITLNFFCMHHQG